MLARALRSPVPRHRGTPPPRAGGLAWPRSQGDADRWSRRVSDATWRSAGRRAMRSRAEWMAEVNVSEEVAAKVAAEQNRKGSLIVNSPYKVLTINDPASRPK